MPFLLLDKKYCPNSLYEKGRYIQANDSFLIHMDLFISSATGHWLRFLTIESSAEVGLKTRPKGSDYILICSLHVASAN